MKQLIIAIIILILVPTVNAQSTAPIPTVQDPYAHQTKFQKAARKKEERLAAEAAAKKKGLKKVAIPSTEVVPTPLPFSAVKK